MIEGKRLFAGFRRKTDVAGTEGESVGFAHKRHTDDFGRTSQICGHPLEDRQLLVIFFAKECIIGAAEPQEFRDNRRNATEMAGTCCTTQNVAQILDFDPGRALAVGIQRFDRRNEQNIGTTRLHFFEIGLFVTRIGRVVFVWTELRWVDEIADDDEISFCASRANQRQMAFMQIAHGRHQTDGFAFMLDFFCK